MCMKDNKYLISHGSNNLSISFEGGWWYAGCFKANLNGFYLGERGGHEYGIIWRDFKGKYYSMKFTEMKIRPKRGDS